MPTQILRYVNPGSVGGDGTSTALTGATAAYASMNAALAAEFTARGTTMVTNDQFLTILRLGTGNDSVRVSHSSAWTTDATHYVELIVDPSVRHAGVWNTGVAYMSGTVNAGWFLCAGIRNLRLTGFQIENTNTGSSATALDLSTAGSTLDIQVRQCIVRLTGAASSLAPVIKLSAGTSGTYLVANSIVTGPSPATVGTGISCGSVGPSHYLYGVTISGCFQGVSRANANGVGRLKDAIIRGLSGGDPVSGGTNWASVDGVATDAASLGTAVPAGTNQRVSQTFSFVNAVGGDYHLTLGDTGARTFGVDLSADPVYPITLDIDGATRGTPWDIGADQVTAVSDNDPTQTTATVPNPQTVSTLRTITVQARKSDGSPMTVGGATVVVTITGANPATPTVTDNGNGIYTCSDTPASTGADSVAITLNGVAISGSPYASVVQAAPTSHGYYLRRRRR